MVRAFVMVKTAPGTVGRVAEAVRGLDAVGEAHVVAGDYDLVAEVEAAEMYDVLDTVANDVRSLDGVTDTKTYVSMDG
ncbi:Lrp/AsnC family transcriptional regulator [Candidatus Halobonum tyrrellensis]|uniref:Transcriptional regulator n=1 Tax=Candidatus Halobonum tyrrellensis G22 TaxID=1324957 RepID=V4IYG4_9EURY|nr:Lrp/AsnC ligand binding domain-containing protein [Candidatus Halobonum tyrrellensis]ESP88182.1 transcriptional regulator [Candidatus Halobonum tyrrellensis G22]